MTFTPIWSPDGSRIVFSSNRKGVYRSLRRSRLPAPEVRNCCWRRAQTKNPTDWSPDGRFCSIDSHGSEDGAMTSGHCRWMETESHFQSSRRTSRNATRNSRPTESGSRTSRTSRAALRFTSSRFPAPEASRQISTNGGAQVRWRRDGKELFYIALDGRLMAVPIRLASDGQTIELGAPVPLFATRVGGAVPGRSTATVHGLSRRPAVPDEHRHGRSHLAHHGHPELEAPVLI